jgi:hypothetical protein
MSPERGEWAVNLLEEGFQRHTDDSMLLEVSKIAFRKVQKENGWSWKK